MTSIKVLILMYKFNQHHPWNFILLFLFTLGLSFLVGAASTQSKGLQIIFPMGKILQQVMGCFGALVFSGFIIYDTDDIIKSFNYYQFINVAMSLFLDFLNLFLPLLGLRGGSR